jgi:hypothetical protein
MAAINDRRSGDAMRLRIASALDEAASLEAEALRDSRRDRPSSPARLVPGPASVTTLLTRAREAPVPEPKLGRAVRTTFERFELKYWMTEQVASRVLEFATPYIVRDENGLSPAAQRNVTLYLDTWGFRFYRMHELLAPDRFKLRVRSYGDPIGPSAFFEIKHKRKTITMKERAEVPLAQVPYVLGGQTDHLPEAVVPRLEPFMRLMTVHRASPKVLVACQREAFESRISGEDVRLTFDRDLVYQPTLRPDLGYDRRAWRVIGDGDSRPSFGRQRVLLELKFGVCPRWLVELVSRFDLKREAFSKYMAAIALMRR